MERAEEAIELINSDAHFAEQFPLAAIDDYMIHQTPDPIRVAASSDPRVYERYWMVCHDLDADLVIATGSTFYPNLDLAEAYAIVNRGGRHTTVRAFRRLGVDRMDMRLGPIAPKIVQGMRHWNFVLDENEWGTSFDLHFRDTTRQVFREPSGGITDGFPVGRRPDASTGFESFGDVEGTVVVGDTTLHLGRRSCRGTRDRHWGIGRSVGGPAMSLGGPARAGVSGNTFVSFETFGIWGDRVFYRYGDPRPGAGRVVSVHRRLRFEPDTHIFTEGVIDYHLDSGETKQLHFERVGLLTAFMRCGMYGGTPDKEIFQGAYIGDDLVEGETYDVSDPTVRTMIAGLDEHVCRVTCDGEATTGIYQPIDPNAYLACSAGRRGWEFLA
ncbi:MAG: hypothetical protein JWN62_4632 [Acidimicrobiales bacterium]|nr:hypothetical protein [Acidimicrobiales bacterium]